MKITLDEQLYELHLGSTIERFRSAYEKIVAGEITLPSSSPFARGSLLRTALKQVMTPLVIPALRKLYVDKGLELPTPPKHTDLIDFVVFAVLAYIRSVEGGYHVRLTSEDGSDSVKTIKSFSASWKREERTTEEKLLTPAE